MTVRDRLVELGITVPQVVAPVAAYVPAVLHGRTVWTSGQLPFADGTLLATGKVGDAVGQVPASYAAHLARIAALNAVAAIGSVADLDGVERIVKVVVFVASDPTFTGQPAVANGASTLLGEIFAEAGAHARSAVGVAVLPLDSPVEVEVVAALR